MSYTNELKKELTGVSLKRLCCEKAILATLYALLSEEKRGVILIKTENLTIGRKILVLSKKLLNFEPALEIKSNSNKKTILITVSEKECIENLKQNLHLISSKANIFQSRIDPILTLDECCKKAVLQTAFLSNGFINSPQKSYHLEISTHKKRVLNDIFDIFIELGLEPKMIERQNKAVLYIKNNEEICDFLNIIGVRRGLFKFHDIKTEKELKNDINRQLNCESANENKVINSSLLQMKAINKIIKSGGLDQLDSKLKDTVKLRLKYPELPLSELVLINDLKITKSGLNHRLNKLLKIAENL